MMNIYSRGLGFLVLGMAVATSAYADSESTAPAPPSVPSVQTKVEMAALVRRIDQLVQQRLVEEKLPVSGRSSDAEFLRRVTLDLTGVIPAPEKIAAFLDSTDSNKRSKAIDELLADPAFGRHMADVWQELLLPRVSDNRRLQTIGLIKWLEEGFNANKPWDQFVRDLLTSSGNQDENGAVTFFLANPTADKMTDTVSRQFLGIQLQCAQCHNHPFTGWKQTEYWGMAAFFTKVRTGNFKKAAKKGGPVGVEEDTSPKGGKRNKLPESAKIVPAKFLQGEEPKLQANEPMRPVLAKWLTAPENPFFAKAAVNRFWALLFGRGFVNPIDDMHQDNPASHPELLQELSQQFIATGFDVKQLMRTICNSETYQRTSKPTGANAEDQELYSHMAVKVMTPGVLYDSLETVIGREKQQQARGKGQRVPTTPRQQFIAFFQAEEGADPTEYQAGIPQALRLMNSRQLNGNSALLQQAMKLGQPEKVVEHLYLSTLSRRPTAAELQRLTAFVAKSEDQRKGYADVLWALLNCSEFALNH